MAIFATGKQSVIMRKFFYLLFAAIVALSVSCKKENKISNSIVIDGASKNIENMYLVKSYYQSNKYDFRISFDGWEDNFEIMLDGNEHLGKDVDLSKKEEDKGPEFSGWWWSIIFWGNDFDFFADGCPVELSESATPFPFESGTLSVKNLGEDEDGVPTIQISLKNGKVLGTDEEIHSVELNFKGKVNLVSIL